MPKKEYHNMTPKQRMAYWEKIRKKERIERKVRIDRLSKEQREAVIKVHELLDSILDTALYPDMGGIAAVSAYELQELSHANDTLQFQFNLKGE
tara:strand:- start:1632 stop:1913 length:282 start_codon:yes stop_codon:yes gene_type:complete